MLSQLYIKNIAVIREASIELGPGFNVFTGETGAGKTMLISAINGVLGERLSRDIIRTGEDTAAVSALFTQIPETVQTKIGEMGYEAAEGELLISREIGAKTGCKINGRPATLQILREIASLLIDVHGQKDNHKLLDPQYHIEYIDSFGELEPQRQMYTDLYEQATQVQKKLRSLAQSDREKERRIALLQFQAEEIENAALHPGEEEEPDRPPGHHPQRGEDHEPCRRSQRAFGRRRGSRWSIGAFDPPFRHTFCFGSLCARTAGGGRSGDGHFLYHQRCRWGSEPLSGSNGL